jgi:hypothetical protein
VFEAAEEDQQLPQVDGDTAMGTGGNDVGLDTTKEFRRCFKFDEIGICGLTLGL